MWLEKEWLEPHTCEIYNNDFMYARIRPFFPDTTVLNIRYENKTISLTMQEIASICARTEFY